MTEFDVALHRALKKFQSAGSVQVKETPPHGEPADLTVAIATYDDFDGAYFTMIRSAKWIVSDTCEPP